MVRLVREIAQLKLGGGDREASSCHYAPLLSSGSGERCERVVFGRGRDRAGLMLMHALVTERVRPHGSLNRMVTPMPNRRRGRRPRAQRVDSVRYPLFYIIHAGTTGTTTVRSISDTFDRSRAFRISHITGEASCTKAPVFFYIEVYSPVSTADNVWASPVHLAVVGPKTRFRYAIPATVDLWYPAQSADTTVLMKVVTLCESKDVVGILSAVCYVTVQMRPVEPTTECVRRIQPTDHQDQGESQTWSLCDVVPSTSS